MNKTTVDREISFDCFLHSNLCKPSFGTLSLEVGAPFFILDFASFEVCGYLDIYCSFACLGLILFG